MNIMFFELLRTLTLIFIQFLKILTPCINILADILIAVLSMSTELLWEAFGEWIFGNFACKLGTYIQCLLFINTSSILISMSYDRYEAICKPMAFSRSLTRSRRMIGVSWVLAALLAIPQLFIFVQVSLLYGLLNQASHISPSHLINSGEAMLTCFDHS